MIVDISAGGNQSVLRFLSACHHQVILGTNEPSSVADAYALIKLINVTMGLSQIIFIPNRVATAREGKLLFEKMNTITAKFLGIALKSIGSISESPDYRTAWSTGKAAVSAGQSTTCYHDFTVLVDELGKLEVDHKNNELQFFNPSS